MKVFHKFINYKLAENTSKQQRNDQTRLSAHYADNFAQGRNEREACEKLDVSLQCERDVLNQSMKAFKLVNKLCNNNTADILDQLNKPVIYTTNINAANSGDKSKQPLHHATIEKMVDELLVVMEKDMKM